MPTSTTATSTGASAKAAYAIPTTVSKNDSGWASRLVDEVGVRRHVVERAHERLVVSGSPSIEIRSLIRSTCGVVNRPVRRSSARSSVSIIRDVDVLPLVPVRWIDRVARCGSPEQLGEGPDPVQGRLEPGLRPAGQQGVLDLGEGLGEPGRCGGLTHDATSLGTRPRRHLRVPGTGDLPAGSTRSCGRVATARRPASPDRSAEERRSPTATRPSCSTSPRPRPPARRRQHQWRLPRAVVGPEGRRSRTSTQITTRPGWSRWRASDQRRLRRGQPR